MAGSSSSGSADRFLDLEKRVRAQETWSANHDGRINVLWDDQHELNDVALLAMTKLSERVIIMEKRLVWIVGFASGMGTLITGAGAKLLGIF